MRNKFFLAILSLIMLPITLQATDFINLTPKPKSMTVGQGHLVLPADFEINSNALPDSIKNEAIKFAHQLNVATGLNVAVNSDATDALFNLSLYKEDSPIGIEGYTLDITPQGVAIKASTATGFYYAFQTIKKILPPCVMAGVRDMTVQTFALPILTIQDSPRFDYRGFMLDVSRHFFSVEEVKRMIDVMSYYKMNRFHWHLSDDQGWRIEIKKYPKLTSVGSVRSTSWDVDPIHGRYNTFQPYGPYFYTREEAEEVVAYAKERHIEIIPEIDMPGHFCAALAAYPEYSCNPKGGHTVQTDGGIFSDVMNVANPQAVQFTKDILDELSEIFPYPSIHIGGDECPTSAWESNAECKKMVQDLGYNGNFRKLQTHFIKTLSDYMADKPSPMNRKLVVWNEAISASGVGLDMMKETDATVMCWNPCDASALKAAELGLKNIVTPYGPYYINRKQSTDASEPEGAGNGADNLKSTYSYVPIPSHVPANLHPYYTGVQGTFWAEHVSSNYLLEYLALPRLIAIAETGWTPQENKNFEDFRQRITADSILLNYNNYAYGKHYMQSQSTKDTVMPESSSDNKMVWYRLVTRNTADANRVGKCIELLRAGSPIIGTGNAKENRLWSAVVASTDTDPSYNYQFWALKEDPANPGHYALVNKAKPNGSVNPVATAQNNTARWDYDEDKLNYNFILGDRIYMPYESNYCYSIRSNKSAAGLYMNMAASGQQNSINQYNDPADGSGGIWEFRLLEGSSLTKSIEKTLQDAEKLIADSRTYAPGERKIIGYYSATQKEALQTVIKENNVSEMNEAQQIEFLEKLKTAISAFKNSLAYPEEGKIYRIANTIERFEGIALTDEGKQTLQSSDNEWALNAWTVESTEITDTCQTAILKNVITGRYISGATSPLNLSATGTSYKLTYVPATADFMLKTGNNALFPIASNYSSNPGCIYVGGKRPQGTGWKIEETCLMTYQCKDEKGNEIATYHQTVPVDTRYECNGPSIENHEILSYTETGSQQAPWVENVTVNKTIEIIYRRTACHITLNCYDATGSLVQTQTDTCVVGENYAITYPQIKYYTYLNTDWTGETSFVADTDLTITATYTTEALTGFKAIGKLITELKDGGTYLLQNATSAAGRSGLLNVNPDDQVIFTNSGVTAGSPYYVWTLAKSGEAYQVKNGGGNYIPNLPKGDQVIATSQAGLFNFIKNADGESWSVKGTNNMYWNGNPGKLTGWTDAHPYKVYEVVAAPYFKVSYSCVDSDGNSLAQPVTVLVEAGSAYELTKPEFEGYSFASISGGDEQLAEVGGNLSLTLTYRPIADGMSEAELTPSHNKALYDLEGRQTPKVLKKGIYIRNGKKVVLP